ncbi:MAG TPA: LytTR family DNA-binding domain-containing protein [Bordetella sp.]|jgi:two-component system LytT family response regulator|nr:LytTR family DNA-binding domain-containing protein [Bordetella sp.]
MLRVIIVDDEAPARRYLRRLLEAHPDVAIVGEAGTQDEAAQLVRIQKPDALFLDIELARGTGFDVLDGLDQAPAVVFVTAHADHAVRAFEVAATDYLLKPATAPRLAGTLSRLRQARARDAGATAPDHPDVPATAHLLARTRQGLRRIGMDALSAVLAHGDYVRLCCADGSTELIHATLSSLRPQLPTPPFFQASRSMIVNLDHVASVGGDGRKYVEFTRQAAPIELGITAFDRLRRELSGRPFSSP